MPYKDKIKAAANQKLRQARYRATHPDAVRDQHRIETQRRRDDSERRSSLFLLFRRAHLRGTERKIAKWKYVNRYSDQVVVEKLIDVGPAEYAKLLAKIQRQLQEAMTEDSWLADCKQCGAPFHIKTISRSATYCSRGCFAVATRTIDVDLALVLYRRNLGFQKVADSLGASVAGVYAAIRNSGEPMRTRTNVLECIYETSPGVHCGKPVVKFLNKTNGRMAGTRCEWHLKIKQSEWCRNARKK